MPQSAVAVPSGPDMSVSAAVQDRTRSLAASSFGLIYGAILVLSLLMALDGGHEGPFEPAMILFGSVLAVTLAKGFAELLSHAMETGERVLTRAALSAAWRHSHPTLSVANVPTALFVAAGIGWVSMEAATLLSQIFCILVLVTLGARVGWVVGRGVVLPAVGGLFAGGIGAALAAMKHAIH